MRQAGGRLAAAVLVGLAAAPVMGGAAGERLRVGSERLEWQLRGLRTRVEREPRASDYELERARREMTQLRVERSHDPRLLRLEQQIRDPQWRADRAARQDTILPRAIARQPSCCRSGGWC